MSNFIDGDVISYTPKDGHHCREGLAIVSQSPTVDESRAHDTFWAGFGDRHLLTADELATAELIFNVTNYLELDGNSRHINETKWNTFAVADRQVITSQHGLQKRWFIRKGAEPSWQQQIANARERLDEAICAADSAVRSVGYAHAELSILIYRAEAEK